jgi:hypothetical protein
MKSLLAATLLLVAPIAAHAACAANSNIVAPFWTIACGAFRTAGDFVDGPLPAALSDLKARVTFLCWPKEK